MGNAQNNDNNNQLNLINNDDNVNENQNLNEDEENEEIAIEKNFDTLYIKELGFEEQIFHAKNPVLLLKETLALEMDQSLNKKYFIKFKYDSLVNFDCHINFKVVKNPLKKALNKLVNVQGERYILSYISVNPLNKQIIVKNLPKGENMDFSNENAFIYIDVFNELSDEFGIYKKEYDISIEIVPILDKNSEDFKDKNEIVFVNLCNLGVHNGHYVIKTVSQRFKTYGLWMELFDVFDSSNNGLCMICYNKKCNTIILPCNHSFACLLCANHIKQNEKKCPICKNNVEDIIIVNLD
jgi:hypothetical protein